MENRLHTHEPTKATNVVTDHCLPLDRYFRKDPNQLQLAIKIDPTTNTLHVSIKPGLTSFCMHGSHISHLEDQKGFLANSGKNGKMPTQCRGKQSENSFPSTASCLKWFWKAYQTFMTYTPQCWIVVYWYEEENQYLSCLMQTKLVCQTVYHYPHLFACQYRTAMEDYGPSTYKCSHFLESFEIICKMQTFDILWKGNKIAKFKFGQKWHVGSIWIKNFKKIDYCSK